MARTINGKPITREAKAAAHQVKTILMPSQLCKSAPIGPRGARHTSSK